MRLQLIGGHLIRARSYTGLVRNMASEKFVKPSSLKIYRRGTASRIQEMYGVNIRTDTNKNFIDDMIEKGLATWA